MAFMQVKSTNPKLSYIIRKNPESGMVVRSVKRGRLFGYYSRNDASVFNCYFKDSDTENSYKEYGDSSFEYVNASQYNAPQFVLDSISNFFSHVIKKDNEDDTDGFENSVTINMIYVRKRYMEIFQRYFDEFKIEYEEICENNFLISFKTNKSLKDLMGFTQLFAIFNVLKSRHLEEAEIEKYLEYMIKVKAPYFIKYVFKVNVLNNPAKFNQFKEKLEQNSFENIDFEYGFTGIQRQNKVEQMIGFDRSIVDFGCGEGQYIRRFSKKLDDKGIYYAVDIDEDMREKVKKRSNEDDNVSVSEFFPDVTEDLDVMMVEVMEHMEIDAAKRTIKNILDRENVKTLVVTTPNKDFNQFFSFDDEEMRHDDHHFEMTQEIFHDWFSKIAGDSHKVEFFDIGDKVNGIPCTLGAKVVRA